MNVSELSIRRPVTTTLVMVAILLFGAMGYRLLPVSDLPNVDFPVILVTATLPGANPETMASAVATPLEKQFSTIAGIDSMSSSSQQGATTITIVFNLSRNIDAAAQDVQSAIAAVQRLLPQNMPSPPSYQKVNPADQPILYIALTSPTLPLSQLDEYGETLMAQRISMVNGVAQVQVYGAQKYATRIQVDPAEMAARQIGIDDVAQAIRAANVNLPTGTLWGRHRAFSVRVRGQLVAAADYAPVIVAYRNGNPVRLEDIGRAVDSVENDKTAAWYVQASDRPGEPALSQRAVVLAIQRQPGTNTVQVADDIKRVLPALRAQLPASVSTHIMYDRSDSIRNSIHDVTFTLVLTLFLVVMVIFLFLRNLHATVIPSLALPLSVVGTFAVMYLLGHSLDNLSMMALTLAVGFVVDDAIVMLENIVRHTEKGESVFEAALNGSREIVFTIISMTLSLAAVFIPVLFMGGIIGRLFHEFAITIGVAILISGFVSLTLTPMLCSRFLKPPREVRHGGFYNAVERAFQAMVNVYDVTLAWALEHRFVSMSILVLTLAGTVVGFKMIQTDFLPAEDRSAVFGQTEGPEGASFRSMVEHQQAVAEVIQRNPNVAAFMSSAGARGGIGASNVGFFFIRLKPRDERAAGVGEVVQELRAQLAQVPGIRAYPQVPPTIQVGGRFTQGQYQFTLQCGDTDLLFSYAQKLEAAIRKLDGFQDVTSDLRIRNPEVHVEIDRDRASTLGVSAQQIESALANAYSSMQVSTIYAPNNTYQVILEVLPQYQLTPSALSMIYIHSDNGQLVPLNAVVSIQEGYGPLSINHSGQIPSVTLSFNLRPGMTLGEAVAAVQRAARELNLPASITTSFQGTAQAFQSSIAGMGLLLLLAIVVIYMVLGVLYESFIHPLTILSALPAAGFGALLTLMAFKTPLSLYAFVGIIMLVGLVKKNGIMMVDFAIVAQREQKLTPKQAIHQACLIRFRPIMMTTVAALMAGLPIALGFGAGAEARRPLGLAVVGGLLFSQMLTLYITPVFYTYMEALRQWLRTAKEADAESK